MNISTPSPESPFVPFEGASVRVAGHPGRYEVIEYRTGARTARIRAVPRRGERGYRNDATVPVSSLRWAPTGEGRL